MKQISIKQFVLECKMVSTKNCKNFALYFLLLMSILILPGFSVKTYGQSVKRFANDVMTIQLNMPALATQEKMQVKLKEKIDKELFDNSYVDYIILYECNRKYGIKFFKTIQDKYSFISNIQNNKYLDSLINNSKCNDPQIAMHVLLFKLNNLTLENITDRKNAGSKWTSYTDFTFAKGGGKYFLVLDCISSTNDLGDKHILNINLNNGSKIQLTPFPNNTSKKYNNSGVLMSANSAAFTPSNLDNHTTLVNSTNINIAYIISGCLYKISLEQLQEMAKYEITSISLSDGSKEIFNTNNIHSESFIKNDVKYILDN